MKLPSTAVSVAVGVLPSALGVADCLPITTPPVTVPFASFTPFTRATVGATSVVFVPSVKVAPVLPTLDSLAPSFTVKPALFTTELPTVMEPSFVKFRCLFKRSVNASLPSASTKILPSADSNVLAASLETPSPTMFTNVFKRCLFTVSELLPANCKPSSIVAT